MIHIFLVFAFFFMFACNRVVERVGSYPITQQDVAWRDQVIRVYYPNEKRSMGLWQLRASFANAEKLKKLGFAISEQDLTKEEERIDKNTLAPEMLKKIKAIFGKNREAYRHIFILPQLADQRISDPAIQSAEGTRVAREKGAPKG